MFSPYSTDKNNSKKIKSHGVTVNPMEKKTLGNTTLYYTTVKGLGNDVKIIGVMEDGQFSKALLEMDDEPLTSDLVDESDDLMTVETYREAFNGLLSQLDEENAIHKKTIDKFNDLPDSLKDKRVYYMRYMYFDGETHEFLGSTDEVSYAKIIDNMTKRLNQKSSTGGSKRRRKSRKSRKGSKKTKKVGRKSRKTRK